MSHSAPLAALARISAALSASLYGPELIRTALGQVGELLPSDGCFLCEFDEATDALIYRGSHGLPPEVDQVMRDAPPLPRGRGSFSQLALSDVPLIIEDLTRDGAMRSPFLPSFLAYGYRSMLGVPLMREGRTMGGLVVFRRTAGPFRVDEIDLLSAFAAECALSMAHARLFALLDERGRSLALSVSEQAAANEVMRVMAGARENSQPVFDTIARKALELCEGEVCAVFSFDGEWIRIRAHTQWTDDGLAAFLAMYPRRPADPSLVAQCVASRRVVHVADIERTEAVPQSSLQLTRLLSLRAVVAVPMLRDGEPIGAIGVMRTEASAFTERQVAVLKTFADQAVIAVETSRLFEEVQARNAEIARHRDRMESELQLAREIQLGMVPSRFPQPGPARPVLIRGVLEPAREIGGDLYDFFWRPDGRLCIVVADVSDKGAPAALYMARTKTLIRALALQDAAAGAAVGAMPSAARILEVVNEELCADNGLMMFVTVWLGILDPHDGTLVTSNAGHPWPLRWRAPSQGEAGVDGEPGAADVAALDSPRGPPLGVGLRSRYADRVHRLAVGDCLLAYTDGITEAEDAAGELFGDERLEQVLARQPRGVPADVVDAVLGRVRRFASGVAQADDIALLAFVRLAPPPALRRLELVRGLESLAEVAEAVDGLAASRAWPDEACSRLQVVLDEALSNVMQHAVPTELDPAVVRVWIAVDDDEVVVEIEDAGPPFDPTAPRAPLQRGDLASRPVGGLGLHFMRSLCRSMRYERDGGLNRLSLTVSLTATPAA